MTEEELEAIRERLVVRQSSPVVKYRQSNWQMIQEANAEVSLLLAEVERLRARLFSKEEQSEALLRENKRLEREIERLQRDV